VITNVKKEIEKMLLDNGDWSGSWVIEGDAMCIYQLGHGQLPSVQATASTSLRPVYPIQASTICGEARHGALICGVRHRRTLQLP
jgi:hypothetical protein